MEILRDLNTIGKTDVPLAGGKGASLGEMMKAGIPVPPGFVILSSAYEKFLAETDLDIDIASILDSVKRKELHTIKTASEKINTLILQAEIPQDISSEIKNNFKKLNSKYVAVRSSATAEDSASAAWAGQLESYLNTPEENLLENVKRCWASLFTPRAIIYRFEKGLHKHKTTVAVVVQEMVESEKSGTAFSVHPVSHDRNQLIIEAGFGLGEAIVSGQITPDSYVINKQPRRIIDKHIQAQTGGLYRAENGGNEWRDISKRPAVTQVLSDKEIFALTDLILKIENHYSFPVDIEWAFKDESFYIIQSRPITTLKNVLFDKKSKEKWFVLEKTPPIDLFICYPIMRAFCSNPLTIHNFGIGLKNVLFINDDKESALCFVKKEWDNVAAAYKETLNDVRRLSQINNSIHEASGKLDSFINTILTSEPISYDVAISMYQKFLKYLKSLYSWAMFYEVLELGPQKYFTNNLRNILKNRVTPSNIKSIPEIDNYLSILAATQQPSWVQREHEDFLVIANNKNNKSPQEIKNLVTKHTRKYFWIPGFDASSTWDEKYFTEKLNEFSGDANSDLQNIHKERQELARRQKHLEKKLGLSNREKQIFKIARELSYLKDYRRGVQNKAFLITALRVLPSIARKLHLQLRDIRWLTIEEVEAGMSANELKEIISNRKECWMYVYHNGREEIIGGVKAFNGKKREFKFYKNKEQATDFLKGFVAYGGTSDVVKGVVRIINTRGDTNNINKGEILVSYMTNPDIIEAIHKAKAIITDMGGITCHAAITARELKKPCIIGTEHATAQLKDGDIVEMDMENGIIIKI